MFEAVELGQKLSREEFAAREPELRTRLLAAQRALREKDVPVIVIVSGVEGAGKGAVVDRLNKWLDTRDIRTHAFWDETDEERERPRYWRFWRTLPPRGYLSILFGSWYTRPIVARALGEISDPHFDRELARIADFERMLTADGALLVKLWFHLTRKAQKKRLRDDPKRASALEADRVARRYSKLYDTFREVSERAIRATDTGLCPWHLIEAQNRRFRDLTAGRTVLAALEQRLESGPPAVEAGTSTFGLKGTGSVLETVDLEQTLDEEGYKIQIEELQSRFYRLAWQAHAKKISTVAVFEGWDAAGKGSAIRRVSGAVDARLCRVISIAAPTDEERAHHYLWRFWRHLPRDGAITIFDRSWYGRVLVERVEGFASEADWGRSYREITAFEEQLAAHGTVVLKFWIHISPEEQLRRFHEREKIPWKQHKITEEDWRNREKGPEYEAAVNEMVTRTSTVAAPWTLIAGSDKKHARVSILEEFCRRLQNALEA